MVLEVDSVLQYAVEAGGCSCRFMLIAGKRSQKEETHKQGK